MEDDAPDCWAVTLTQYLTYDLTVHSTGTTGSQDYSQKSESARRSEFCGIGCVIAE